MGKPVPMARWGKDHWSTFAYAECCAVDNKGLLNKENMRCNTELHPAQANRANAMRSMKKYPTKLKGWDAQCPQKHVKRDHDDWSCLEDAEAAGLLKLEGTGLFPVVVLTPLGQAVAGRLREHKAQGGSFSTFNA